MTTLWLDFNIKDCDECHVKKNTFIFGAKINFLKGKDKRCQSKGEGDLKREKGRERRKGSRLVMYITK